MLLKDVVTDKKALAYTNPGLDSDTKISTDEFEALARILSIIGKISVHVEGWLVDGRTVDGLNVEGLRVGRNVLGLLVISGKSLRVGMDVGFWLGLVEGLDVGCLDGQVVG